MFIISPKLRLGHPYLVGECGNPEEEMVCPEIGCSQLIGAWRRQGLRGGRGQLIASDRSTIIWESCEYSELIVRLKRDQNANDLFHQESDNDPYS